MCSSALHHRHSLGANQPSTVQTIFSLIVDFAIESAYSRNVASAYLHNLNIRLCAVWSKNDLYAFTIFFLFIISVWFSVFALYRCLFLSFIWENLRLSCSNWQRLVNEDHRRAGDGQRIHLCICKNRRREQKNNNLVPMARSVAHTMNQMNKWIRAEGQKIGRNNNNQMETIINAGVEREKCIDCSNKQRMRKSKEREKYQWMLLATTQFVFNFHINWKWRILNIKLHLVMLELFFLLCFCKIIACDS